MKCTPFLEYNKKEKKEEKMNILCSIQLLYRYIFRSVHHYCMNKGILCLKTKKKVKTTENDCCTSHYVYEPPVDCPESGSFI